MVCQICSQGGNDKIAYFRSSHAKRYDDLAATGMLTKIVKTITEFHVGMFDWRNWLEQASPVQEVLGSNPGRDTGLVLNSGKFCNPSFLGG